MSDEPETAPLQRSIEAERFAIRSTLKFTHNPLEGKGESADSGFETFRDAPFRAIVEEMLLIYWEISTQLTSGTVRGDINRLSKFFDFFSDTESSWSRAHQPKVLADITGQTLMDFQHWLCSRPNNVCKSLLEEREATLARHLESEALPFSCRSNSYIVNMSALDAAIGAPQGYINRHSNLVALVARVAAQQCVKLQTVKCRTAAPSILNTPFNMRGSGLRLSYIANVYYTLSKVFRALQIRRRDLLNSSFFFPALMETVPPGGVRSAALSAAEFEVLNAACLRSIKNVKRRLLIDGPSRAASGHADPAPGETWPDWGRDTSNLIAYLVARAPGEAIGDGHRSTGHGHYIEALRRSNLTALDVAYNLYPSILDLCPFLIRISCSESAPLNISSIVTLNVDLDNKRQHCVRPSPSPGFKRIFFSKPRANIVQTYVDVPDRSSLDIPGLIVSLIEITRPLRDVAPPHIRNNLFLYISRNRGIRALTPTAAVENLRIFVAAENIRGSDGQLLRGLHYRRLRPTVVSSVALDHGIDTAQNRASHANPARTLAYVNNPANDQRINLSVTAAQSKAIASVKVGFSQRPSRRDIEDLSRELKISFGAAAEILAGKRDKLFNGCVDDENGLGPEAAGNQCTHYESCLVCVNSVILERHLARLIAYQQHWLSMWDEMTEDAWYDTYGLNCAIVDFHLTKFDPQVVERARIQALSLPFVVGYRRFKQS